MDVQEHFLALLQPPSKLEIAGHIEMMDVRGFQKDIPLAAQEKIARDWIEDLKEFPADLVELACKRWRRANHNRPPYASGELMESVKPEYVRRKSMYLKAKAVLELIA